MHMDRYLLLGTLTARVNVKGLGASWPVIRLRGT